MSDKGRTRADRALEKAVEKVRESIAEDLDPRFREIADEGLTRIAKRAPLFASAAVEELGELFSLAADADPADLEEMAYSERRAVFKQATREGMQKARERAERLAAMADLVDELAALAPKLLPLLLAAL